MLDRVLWTILFVQNKACAWARKPNAINGLAWGDSEVDGTTDWRATPILGGICVTTSSGSIKLTDVVGERIVTLKAETTINGIPFTEVIEVGFGKGPLSVFAKPPSTIEKKWATAGGIDNKNDFTASSTAFPAAEICGGTVHSGSSDIIIGGSGPESYTADFSGGLISGHWRSGDEFPDCYYSITSKLPTIGQIMAVSSKRPTIDQLKFKTDVSKVKRIIVNSKGAAIAAGWPLETYWTGQVYFDSFGNFYAYNVILAGNKDYWYSLVTDYFFVAFVL
jgi:hypothetical protein